MLVVFRLYSEHRGRIEDTVMFDWPVDRPGFGDGVFRAQEAGNATRVDHPDSDTNMAANDLNACTRRCVRDAS